MARLIEDAEKLDDTFKAQRDEAGELTLSYGDVVNAIHIVQTEMGITGTTAKEAASTISGSLSSLKASWTNLITGLGSGADLGPLIDNVVSNAETLIGNVLPVVEQALTGMAGLVERLAPMIGERLPGLVQQILPPLMSAATTLINSVAAALPELLGVLMNMAPELLSVGMELASSLVTAIVEYLGTHTEEIITAGITLMGTLLENTGAIVDAIVTNLPGIIDGIVSALTKEENVKKIIKGGVKLLGTLLNNVDDILLALGEGVVNLVKGVVDLITGHGDDSADAGKDLMSHLADEWDEIEWDISVEEMLSTLWNLIKSYNAAWQQLGAWIWGKIKEGFMSSLNNILSGNVTANDWTDIHKTQPEEYAGAGAGRAAAQAFTTPTSRAEVFRVEETAFQAGLSAGGGGDTYNVTIDAASVKEFNDIVDIAQNARRERRMATA